MHWCMHFLFLACPWTHIWEEGRERGERRATHIFFSLRDRSRAGSGLVSSTIQDGGAPCCVLGSWAVVLQLCEWLSGPSPFFLPSSSLLFQDKVSKKERVVALPGSCSPDREWRVEQTAWSSDTQFCGDQRRSSLRRMLQACLLSLLCCCLSLLWLKGKGFCNLLLQRIGALFSF